MPRSHDTITPDIETASDGYRHRFAGEIGEFLLHVQEQLLGELLEELQCNGKFLEFGGGHAQVTQLLLRHASELTVQGSSPECAKYLAPFASAHHGRFHFVHAPLWKLPFEQGAFDLTVALRVMAHVERWRELLAEMARLSQVAVIIDYPSTTAFNVLTPFLFPIKRMLEKNTRPYFSYGGREIRDHLRELGFHHFSQRRQFVFPMGVHRALKNVRLSAGAEGMCDRFGLRKLFGSPVLLCATRNAPH